MSLTSELKNNPLLISILQEELKILNSKTLLGRSSILYELYGDYKEAGVVGTAFDYLLRFKLEKDNGVKSILTVRGNILALGVIKYIEEFADKRIINNAYIALDIIDSYFKNKELSYRDYLSAIIYFSCLDSISRNGSFDLVNKVKSIEKLSFSREFSLIYSDLKNLTSNLTKDNLLKEFSSFKKLETNPMFSNSRNLGGADADLILDDLLLDIKTVTRCKIDRDMFFQIVCYYILAKFDGKKLSKVGIYFSRYNYLKTFDIRDLISKESEKKLIKFFESEYNFNH